MNKIKKTLALLENNGIIPEVGNFDITEFHIEAYVGVYQKFCNQQNNKFVYSYARKLAGLNLIKLKLSRKIKPSTFKEGLVYMIKNPAWPSFTKIGITIDLNSRLSTYQTSDPFRKYSVEGYDFALDRKFVESNIIQKFNLSLKKSEWIQNDNCERIIRYMRESGILSSVGRAAGL